MGRPKLAKNVKILPWLSARLDCQEGRFIQKGNTLLLNKNYQSLSGNAKNLYDCMANESCGHINFQFPLSLAKKYFIPESTFRRCTKELEEKGFIKTLSSGRITREPNYYSFSLEWKDC